MITQRGDDQKRWALALIRPIWLSRDLLFGRAPFLDMGDNETHTNQHVDVGRQCSVLLDDTFGEPVGRSRAFIQIAVDRPNLAAYGIQ